MPEKFGLKIGKIKETLDKEKRIKEIDHELNEIIETFEKNKNKLTLEQMKELLEKAKTLKKEKEKLEGKEEIEFKEAKKLFQNLKETALYDKEKKQWNWWMYEEGELGSSDRPSYNQLLGVLTEAFNENPEGFLKFFKIE
jgi:hypothetical protein